MALSRMRVIGRSVLAVIAIMMIGTIGYMLIEGMGVLDALYMTTITVTTIGFREVFPLSDAGRLFTILMAFGGIGVILLIGSSLARMLLETDLRRMVGLRRDLSMIRRIKNHVVVCGHGRMGRAVVDVLQQRKVSFVVVEADAQNCHELEERRIPVVQGDATLNAVLQAARVQSARTMIACLADDAHNVFSILLARQLQPEISIIARAVEEEAEERLRLAGADKVINPYRIGGVRLAFTAIKPTVMDFIEASVPGTTMELELAEVVVHPDSDLVGKTLASAEVRQRFGIIVVALKRGDESTFNPGPDAVMHAGDVLVALGPVPAIESIEQATQ
ncbi:MAG: potassium channel protein [bacterium]|nr:potassium channel protein [bacterium]